MTLFWILAGVLTLVALAFILPPLLRSPRAAGVQRDALNVQVIKDQLEELHADLEAGRLDQAAYAAARHDLERSLLEDVEKAPAAPARVRPGGRWMAALLLLVVPALSVLIYQRLGAEPTLERIAAGKAALRAAGNDPQALDAMVEKLAEHMRREPGNVDGWALLGRTYAALSRYQDSVKAYRHAVELEPQNPDLLSDYADALVAAGNGAFTDQVGELLQRALTVDPRHLKSLWLRGHWRYRHDDVPGAIKDWQTVLAALPPGDENAVSIQRQITIAQGRLGQSATDETPATPPAAGGAPVAGSGHIQVKVALDEALRGKVSPDDTLFIYARAVQGPRMPLAIVRKRVADLPLTVTLDDSQAMAPTMTLSKFPQVTVGARVSRSGQAMPASGDLQGSVSPVDTHDGNASITIDKVVP